MELPARWAPNGSRDARLVGTLEYLAPERIKGEEGDFRSDLYSAGAVLYELLVHRLPFERASDFELMRAHLEETPLPRRESSPRIPPELETVVLRALAKKAEDRFATVIVRRGVDFSMNPAARRRLYSKLCATITAPRGKRHTNQANTTGTLAALNAPDPATSTAASHPQHANNDASNAKHLLTGSQRQTGSVVGKRGRQRKIPSEFPARRIARSS